MKLTFIVTLLIVFNSCSTNTQVKQPKIEPIEAFDISQVRSSGSVKDTIVIATH